MPLKISLSSKSEDYDVVPKIEKVRWKKCERFTGGTKYK